MDILSKYPKPVFLSIWWTRFFLVITVFLLIGATFLGISYLKRGVSTGQIITALLTVILVFAYCYKLFTTNIVYLSTGEILLQGVFKATYYPIEDFKRLGAYSTIFDLLYIEFINGKRFHIIVREIRANDIGSFANKTEDTIHDLTQQIEKYK